MVKQKRFLTGAQARVLRTANRHEQISQRDLSVYPKTLGALIKRGYLEQVQLPGKEPYYRITDAGRVALQV
jgi:hypothetical protein